MGIYLGMEDGSSHAMSHSMTDWMSLIIDSLRGCNLSMWSYYKRHLGKFLYIEAICPSSFEIPLLLCQQTPAYFKRSLRIKE